MSGNQNVIQYILPIKKYHKYLFLIFCFVIFGTYLVLRILLFYSGFDLIWKKFLEDLSNSFILALLLGLILIKIPQILSSSRKIELIQSFIRLKKYDDAKKILSDLFTESSKTPIFFNLLGRIELEEANLKKNKTKSFEYSWKYFQIALELTNNNNIDVLNNISLWYYLKNEYEKSNGINEIILKKKAKNLIALTRKIDLLEINKSWNDILSIFQKNIKVFKKNILTFSYYLFIFYVCAKKLEKEDEIKLALNIAPVNKNLPFELLYNFGLMYYQESKVEALRTVLKSISIKINYDNLEDDYINNIKRWNIFVSEN